MDSEVKGPFWQARLEVVELADPVENLALRALFVENAGQGVPGALPRRSATLLMLARPRRVRVEPLRRGEEEYVWGAKSGAAFGRTLDDGQVRQGVRSGELALLLVEAGPGDGYTCLGGEIDLDGMQGRKQARVRLFQALGLAEAKPAPDGLVGTQLAAHASGLSVYGRARLPWQDEAVAAPFLLTGTAEPSGATGARLALERERLHAGERAALLAAWQRLGRYLDPGASTGPSWVALAPANELQVPSLFWDWDPAGAAGPVLHVPGEQLALLLSDRPHAAGQDEEAGQPAASLARAALHSVRFEAVDGELAVAVETELPAEAAAGPAAGAGGTLNYHYARTGGDAPPGDGSPREEIEMAGLALTYDPVETPRRLRRHQGLPEPEWRGSSPLEPALLWGYLPLEDGWLQIPVPNLTEQVYLDAELENPRPEPEDRQPPGALQGALSLSNAHSTGDPAGEQPWTCTITAARHLAGIWHLARRDDGTYRLAEISLRLDGPRVTFDGLLWLATGRPTAADALPDLENWVSGLESLPLRSPDPDRDPFPATAALILGGEGQPAPQPLRLRPAPGAEGLAVLEAWSLAWQADTALLDGLAAEGVVEGTAQALAPAWAWRRHPTLPMIQALPLTQNKMPPNHPGASRQLVPFELPAAGPWAIGVPGADVRGAGAWPLLLADGIPASGWARLADLPLVALSLPGVVLDPGLAATALGRDAATDLPLQYRFDLPYSDEVNALAQPPQTEPDDEAPSPAGTGAEPPPLRRGTMEQHWTTLSERASLAAADAVSAFIDGSAFADTAVQHLVEPFLWPVSPQAELAAYPGRLILDAETALEAETALRGISGDFVLDASSPDAPGDTPRAIRRAGEGDANPFHVEAGSLAAHRGADGAYRDQRGLLRRATATDEARHLLATPLRLQGADGKEADYHLVSILKPLALSLGDPGGGRWSFWFRDLPLRQPEGRFDPARDPGQDVNDVLALSRERNYLAGYEWRLGPATPEAAPEDDAAPETPPEGDAAPGEVLPLPFFGLDFYPLALAGATAGTGGLERVEIDGRLQLPLPDRREMPELSNVVRLAFTAPAPSGGPAPAESLSLAGVSLQSSQGQWPLALQGSEVGDAPRLTWQGASLADGHLQIEGARQCFGLFGVEWACPLGTLTFPQAGPLPPFELEAAGPAGLRPRSLSLDLDTAGSHSLSLILALDLGQQDGGVHRFQAQVEVDLLGDRAGQAGLVPGTAAFLGNLQAASEVSPTVHLGRDALQVDLRLSQARDRWLLPGMALEPGREMPAFAAVTFRAEALPGGVPLLRLQVAYFETLLLSRWGTSLQADSGGAPSPEAVYGSSAGDVACGYTTRLGAGGWQESLLLNGVVEVKNLISWPSEWLNREPANSPTRLVVPGLPSQGPIGHTRHSLRILLNQHTLPAADLAASPDPQLLFTLRDERAWQFLAVVEHQLLDLAPDAGESLVAGRERRWTALQEVRLAAPRRLRQLLQDLGDPDLTAPVPGSGELATPLDYGYLGGDLRGQLAKALDLGPEEMLVVEASAPHWVDGRPGAELLPTTLQFLPNGTQHAILSRPEDYRPSGPADPRWLLLPMPFLGRLQNGDEGGGALHLDPVLALEQHRGDAPALAWALAHRRRGKNAPAAVLVSALDTDLGHTWARLDPTSLEESWFRLQNPAPEPQPAAIASILAALPDGPARASRSAALRRAFDTFRRFYPPAPDGTAAPPVVDGRDRVVWRRDSLLALQGMHVAEGTAAGAGNRLKNGTFEPEPAGPHPAMEIPALQGIRWQVGDDQVPHDWQVLEFAYENRHCQLKPGGGWQCRGIPLDTSKELPAGRRDWGLPRMRPPNPEEQKPAEPPLQGRSWLLYTDAQSPFWIKVGQKVQLPPGHYRLTLWIFPAQESSGVPPREPGDSQVVLFAGGHRGQVLDADRLPFDRWSRAELKFELASAATLDVGVELHGPGRLLRNGWYLNDARLERLPGVADGWHVTATQLRGLDGAGTGRTRHAAATLLPAQLRAGERDNPRPVSLAVSPYLGLEFRPAAGPSGAPDDVETHLLAAELICLHAASGELRPAATKFWEAADDLGDAVQEWARQMHLRLAPDSPLAVLRLREINEVAGQLAVGYRFAVVRNLRTAAPIERRAFPLRTAVEELRFREGQFGGQEMPADVAAFELAPPQTTGVQPLYLTARPATATAATWPWGLSALRLSVRYTPGSQGVVGPATSGGKREGEGEGEGEAVGEGGGTVTLWWQAPQQMVQYRTPGTGDAPGSPAWSLPALFRAPAIKSLLPVLPAPPLPLVDLSDEGLAAWQPVLPGGLHYLLLGARPGVMLAIRNQLLRQRLAAGGAGQRGQGLVSGSVPVQHRVPRPVPLPANRPEDREHALQPWAGFFEPEHNLSAGPSPADEAFFAAWGDQPARRLRLVLNEPARGEIDAGWDGTLAFEIDAREIEPLEQWLRLELVDGAQTLSYGGGVQDAGAGIFRFALENPDALHPLLEGRAAGQTLIVQAHVGHDDGTDGYRQVLTFPLRVVDRARPRLPLVPMFVSFEDPEYNRRLASPAATASGNVRETQGDQEVLHTVTLATDRREYNPGSRVALRHDWDDERDAAPQASLSFRRVDRDGNALPLTLAPPSDGAAAALPPARLVQISLADLREGGRAIRWQTGDLLQIELKIPGADSIFLGVQIVARPVIPAPEAAYALLRREGEAAVSCPRFAWRPEASRIDLVCPDDLRTGVVRRRAVFHWTDAVRPGRLPVEGGGYAVQKIAENGSTHFPQL